MDLARLPWPLLMASASLAAIASLYLARPDVFRRFGFGREEVALLCLGAIAGWAINLPVVPVGHSFLALNVGGALLALFLAGLWFSRGLLPVVRTLLGVALVAAITNAIVAFEPETGIVAVYPWFFLPPLAAFFWAVLVAPHDLRKAVPVAFVSGSLGALVGADLLNVPQIHEHFGRATSEAVVVSVGGAGVFDMVFLAGVLPMAAAVALLAALTPRAGAPPLLYPGPAVAFRSPADVWAAFSELPDPNARERAIATLALSDRALEEGDVAKSVRMSWLAVDCLLRDERAKASVPEAMRPDLDALARAWEAAMRGVATRESAGAANRAAKLVVGYLGAAANLASRLEGR